MHSDTGSNHTCVLHWLRREVQAVKQQIEALITLASEQGFPRWVANGKMFRGWALAMQGQVEEGIAQIRQGLTRPQDQPLFLPAVLLAEAYGAGGLAEEGLGILAEALVRVENTGVSYREAMLYCLKGELLLKWASPDAFRAEACFRQALDVARRQHAKSLELRAATSLARLWQQQGKHHEAYDLLAPLYEWFTEGFDTADLKDTKGLLAELS